MPCVSGLDSVDTKWMWIIYVKFLVDTLVLIRVSLQAANCAWPWLDINKKRRLSGNFFAKRFLIDVCNGATLQIGHDWTIDFLVKAFDSLVFLGNLFGEHMLIYVLMSILLINFAWFWSKCCFQIPGPCVRGHLLYNKCRTCTIISNHFFFT